MIVTLSALEIEAAGFIGMHRHVESKLAGHREYFTWGDTWENHIVGAVAEYAVAKHTGQPWTGTIGRKAVADVGEKIQVRCALSRADGPLNVYPSDPDDHFYVLVVPDLPDFDLVGWIRGRDAKQISFWQEFENNRQGGAFRIPQNALTPIREAAAA